MSTTLPWALASQMSCSVVERVLRLATIASLQSWLIGSSLWNGSMPLVQVAKFAPKPPKAGLLLELKPAPQLGAEITARNRSSEATPVVSAAVDDSPFEP